MSAPSPIQVVHVVAGTVVQGGEIRHEASADRPAFVTPTLDLDCLAPPRSRAGPAFDVPIAEIIDFLAECGRELDLRTNAHLADALDRAAPLGMLPPALLGRCYADLPRFFERDRLCFAVDQELGAASDGWTNVREPSGRGHQVRAFPPRLVHVLAGNGPGVAALSIVRGALTKGIHLLKLPSNDPFTATAILRTMIDLAPDHPVTRSFSAVYWRGGDDTVEGALFRPQFFDKLVAWGGEAAIRHALRYVGPGFELVPFDPKISISMIGGEAFASDGLLHDVAALAARDATILDQDACAASRYQYVEGSVDAVDRFCGMLVDELSVERDFASAGCGVTPRELRDQVEILRELEPSYRVWGGAPGRGTVIRSEAPVDFPLSAKTVNVIPVADLGDAVRHANVATQTVGVFPDARRPELRDALVAFGVQRIVALGSALEGAGLGLPHDDMYALHRLVRWVVDEGV